MSVITSMITNRIVRHKVLVSVNHNHNNFRKKTNKFGTDISAREILLMLLSIVLSNYLFHLPYLQMTASLRLEQNQQWPVR